MKCTEFQAEFLAGGMSRAADSHLAGCSACRSHLTELRSIRGVIEDPATWEEPSAELEGRVVGDIAALTGGDEPDVKRWPAYVSIAAAIALIAAASWVFAGRAQPDWSVALTATDAAPAASATVDGWNTDAGTRMRLEVAGLPDLEPDTYYEIWLTADDGRHVSAGTFSGNGEIDAWIAVRRSDFPRVWVTIEENDDNEALAGVTVLDTPG